MSKEMWIEAWQSAYDEAIDEGKSAAQAEQIANRKADGRYRENIADMIDHARLLKKEGKL